MENAQKSVEMDKNERKGSYFFRRMKSISSASERSEKWLVILLGSVFIMMLLVVIYFTLA